MTAFCQCQFETVGVADERRILCCGVCGRPKQRAFVPDAFTMGAELGDKQTVAKRLGISVSTLDREFAANPKLLTHVGGQVRGHWPTIVENYFPKEKKAR